MSDEPIWRERVIVYRKKFQLTQAEMADRLQVSQQTISRWESGRQVPEPQIQQRLRQALGLADLVTRQSWISRVNLSAGREHLFERGWKILALSPRVAESHEVISFERPGMSLYDFPLFRPLLEVLEKFDPFSGDWVHVKLNVEFHLPHRSVGRHMDYWPVLTGSDELLVHGIAYPYAVDRPREVSLGEPAFIRVLDPVGFSADQSNSPDVIVRRAAGGKHT